MKLLTVFFLALLMIGSAVSAVAAEPCRTRYIDFSLKSTAWTHVPLSKLKRDTIYTLAQTDGRSVVRGEADGSASFFVSRFQSAMEAPKSISWQWMTQALVPGADNRDKNREDASLRVIVAFDGDHATLPDIEKKRFNRAKRLSGLNLPYALLMYIWSDHVPVNTVIPSAHTNQVKMLVAATGIQGLGQWQTVKRDLVDDYRRAFGADPGPVLGVAIMTDTDNTHSRATGEYSEILMECSGNGAK